MNADHPAAGFVLSDDHIASARKRSAATGRSIFDELESESAQSPRHVVAAVGTRLGMRVVDYAEMSRCEPAFDRLSLVNAMARTAVLLRTPGDGRLLAVTPDAFDLDLSIWLEAHAGWPAETVLALRSDIQDRGPGFADRSPGAHHRAREQRVRCVQSLRAHEHRSLCLCIGVERNLGAAAGADRLPALRRSASAR